MPVPNNPDVVKVALVFKRDLRTFINTLHFAKDDGWLLGDMQALAAEIVDWWLNSYRSGMCSVITLQQVQVRLLDPSNPLAVDWTTGLPSAGALATAPEAANVTETISWRTNLAGRKYRGRIYVPSVPENAVTTDDRADSPFVTGLAGIAQYLLNNVGTGGSYPVVFHAATNLFTRIVSYVIENILDSQRRRLPNRGR